MLSTILKNHIILYQGYLQKRNCLTTSQSSSTPFYRAVSSCAEAALPLGPEGKESSIRIVHRQVYHLLQDKGIYTRKKNISLAGFLTPLLLKQGGGGMSMRMLKKSQKLVCKNLNQYVKCVCMDVDMREGGRGSTLCAWHLL